MTFQPAFFVEEPTKPDEEFSIRVRLTGFRAPSVEERDFYSRGNRTHSRISRLLPEKSDILKRYVAGVRSAMKVALESEGGIPSGSSALDSIQSSFIDDIGPNLRRTFLQATLLHGAALFVAAVAMASIISAHYASLVFMVSARDILFDAAWVAAGAAVGIVFFAFVNSITITFENVGRFDSTGLGPTYRLIFVAIVLIVLSVLLLTDAITIGIGNVTLNKFRESSFTAFLLGLFGAYSDIQATRLISGVLDRSGQGRAS